MIKYSLFFAAGVATGLLAAKLYARVAVGDAIHEGLDKIGAGGGVIEDVAKKVIVPLVA